MYYVIEKEWEYFNIWLFLWKRNNRIAWIFRYDMNDFFSLKQLTSNKYNNGYRYSSTKSPKPAKIGPSGLY